MARIPEFVKLQAAPVGAAIFGESFHLLSQATANTDTVLSTLSAVSSYVGLGGAVLLEAVILLGSAAVGAYAHRQRVRANRDLQRTPSQK